MIYQNFINTLSQVVKVKPDDFNLFSKKLSLVHLKKNEVWEKEGRIGQYLGFINKGILRQYHLKDGQEFTEDFFSENDFIGNYISYLKQEPSTLNIQALEDCELFVITFEDLQKFYDEIPTVDRFGRLIAERKLIEYHDKTTSFLLDSPEERYYKLIQQKPDLHSRVKQYYIAQYLGIRPESLSRIRKRHHSK